MRPSRSLLMVACCCALLAGPVLAEPGIADARLRQRMEELAASTLQGGAGWQAYAQLLHPGYSRWAMGEVFEDRETFAGPDDTTGGFTGYVTNVWVRENGDWTLLSAEIANAARDGLPVPQ